MADLSQPLHNIEYSHFSKRYHKAVDGVVNDEVLENLDKIKVYPIQIGSEEGLAKEIARVANLAVVLRYRLEDESRVLTKEESYEQLGHSASLFRGVREYAKRLTS